MARPRRWTRTKRRLARQKAQRALDQRRAIVACCRGRRETRYAGLIPAIGFARHRLGIRRRLEDALPNSKGRTAVYTPTDEAMAYLGAQMAGIARLGQLDRLLPDWALAQALELPQWPSENTQQRFLKRANEESIVRVDRLIEKVLEEEALEGESGLIEVDGDTTAVPQRAQKREGVEPGWCGAKVHRCYQQPRVTVNGLPYWSDLRRGSDGCKDLFERTLKIALKMARKYPKREVVFRLDGHFVSRENVLRAQAACRGVPNLGFLFPVHFRGRKNTRWEALLRGSRGPWRRLNAVSQARELGVVDPWTDSGVRIRAVAVLRQTGARRRGEKRKPGQRQGVWRYLIVTNRSSRHWSEREVFENYQQRQREEFSFKDGKQSLSMAKMPTASLTGNRMHVKMVALSQLIIHLFSRKFLPDAGRYGPMGKTVREKVMAVGGKNRY